MPAFSHEADIRVITTPPWVLLPYLHSATPAGGYLQ